MNKERRKALDGLYERLSTIRDQLEELIADASGIRDEEAEAHGNLPDSLQQSERGQAMEEAQTEIESAEDEINSAIEAVGNAMDKFEDLANVETKTK